MDEGCAASELKDGKQREAAYKVIQERIDRYQKGRPGGYFVREVPKEDLDKLKGLEGT